MRVLLVEDERLAANRLAMLLQKAEPSLVIAGQTDSVRTTIDWLNNNEHPDLVFLDIRLADGVSFQIFEEIDLKAPIIFTTAYDEYAIKAFKVNSIDYLLKPVDEDDLNGALQKYRQLKPGSAKQSGWGHQQLESLIAMMDKSYKERFIIKVGDHIKSVEVKNVYHFLSHEKATFLQTSEGKKYIVDFTLDQVEGLVDPNFFFRINRKYLIAFSSIKDIVAWSNSRLKLILHHCDDPEIVVAREKVNAFKEWLDK